MKEKNNSEEYYTQFDNVFFEKTRLSILTMLYKEEFVSFNRFKKMLGSSDGAIYTHLQKLVDVNYIKSRKEIKSNQVQTTYSLTEAGRRMFKKYMDFLESIVLNR